MTFLKTRDINCHKVSKGFKFELNNNDFEIEVLTTAPLLIRVFYSSDDQQFNHLPYVQYNDDGNEILIAPSQTDQALKIVKQTLDAMIKVELADV